MKKIGILVGALILSLFAFAEERSVMILAPSDLDIEDVKIVGTINGEAELNYEKKDESIEKSEQLNLNEVSGYTTYGNTKYIKLSVDGLGAGDEVRYIAAYESGEENGLDRFTIISSPDITNYKSDIESEMADADNPLIGLGVLDYLVANFDEDNGGFPGKELTNEEVIVSGIVVGDKIISETNTDPSNIVDIYYAKGDPGDSPINVVEGGASLNPTAGNNTLRMWAVKTDSEGNVLKDTNGNPIRQLLYSNKSDEGETPLYSDFHLDKKEDFEIGTWYPSDDLAPPFGDHKYFVYDLSIRFQGDWVPRTDVEGNFLDENGNIVSDMKDAEKIDAELWINGENVIKKGDGKKEFAWNFLQITDITLDYFDKGNFIFDLSGKNVVIDPEEGQEVPFPIAQKIYVMDDDGKLMEGSATVTSKYEDTVKYRSSNIKMKVMTKEGEKEEHYEIINIAE